MKTKRLSALRPGETGAVAGEVSGRLYDLGLMQGTKVTCLQKSPMGDPAAYAIRGAVFAIRKSDADAVTVTCSEVEPWD